MAYTSGFTAHPRVSWAGAAPTGAASEAEYVELALAEARDPAQLARDLDAALAPGIDVLEAVVAQPGTGKLPDRIDSSQWEIRLFGIEQAVLAEAVGGLWAVETAPIERVMKDGRRTIDVRAALVSVALGDGSPATSRVSAVNASDACAILTVVVRQTTPVVRPDDVVTALSSVAGLPAPISSLVTRLAQGRLLEDGSIADPLAADREAAVVSPSVASQER
jgi:radical SAM-linked protein